MKLFSRHNIHIFFFLLMGVLISSCGIERDYKDSQENFSFGQAVLSGGRPLNDTEMSIALRVCYAFRSKRTKFSAELLGRDFNFNLKTKSCMSSTAEVDELIGAKLSQLLISGPLSFESSYQGSYSREVETDTNGQLTHFCSQVLKGETPLNVYENADGISEYLLLSGVYDNVQIKTGSVNRENGPLLVNSIVTLEVLTNQSVSGDLQGLVVKTTKSFPCRGATDTETSRTHIQTYLE